MGPIEALWGVVVLIFVVISLARGYNRELGVTVLMLIILFLELQFGPRLELILRQQAVPRMLGAFGIQPANDLLNLLEMFIFQSAFILVVFATYAGRSFAFPGKPPGGATGFFFNTLVGLVNGILFAGTLWYYLDKFEYPYLERLGLLYPDLLTDRAKLMIRYLPPRLFENRPEVLAAFAGLLVIFSVRR